MRIGELTHELERRVVIVNRALAEVRHEQHRLGTDAGQGDALVNRAITRRQHLGGIAQGGPPAGNRPAFAREDEQIAVEGRGVVEQLTGRGPAGNRDNERIDAGMGRAGDIVGDCVQS